VRALLTITSLLLAACLASGPAHAQEESAPPESAAPEAAPSAERDSEDAANVDEAETDPPDLEAAAPEATVAPDVPTVPSSGASSALGLVTVLGAVATAASIGVWLEREDNVGVCARYAMEDPPTLGCLNTSAIRDQRDIGIGLTIGFGTITIGAAIAWAIVAATAPQPPAQTGFTCAPGVFSVACAGRF